MAWFPSQYQEYIHLSRYARWSEDRKRRETWDETVGRYFDFFESHLFDTLGYRLSPSLRARLEHAVLHLQVMPSMRAMMTAGEALRQDQVAGYNCSFVTVDRVSAFDEAMYILMCGTGVGFSVENAFVSALPMVPETLRPCGVCIVVDDSRIGWCQAFRQLLMHLYQGEIPTWNLDRIRPEGTRLKTFGGRSSGPEPLNRLFRYTVETFERASGRRLTSLECHDIMCMIGEIVVSGGTRRSALISLSDLSDELMRVAKSGDWWIENYHRSLSNNSAVYDVPKLSEDEFWIEWNSLRDSCSGERGIFNRAAARTKLVETNRSLDFDYGTNPCGEILLRPSQFCNLSEAIIRSSDSREDIQEKVQIATILGTIQSTLVNFRYLNPEWRKNSVEERLLGVSLTGICDNPLMYEPDGDFLNKLRNYARHVNQSFAADLGINPSAAITCVKPSGTVSALVDSASGIHPRYARHYIRGVIGANSDPVTRVLKKSGVPWEYVRMNKKSGSSIFYFPQKSPSGSLVRSDLTAKEQFSLWLSYRLHWCDHNPSCTIYVRENEWDDIGRCVYENFDQIGGLSFLPYFEDDTVYKQLPYREVSEDEYQTSLTMMPTMIDWSLLSDLETDDMTTGSREFACVSGSCELG